jgi:hypothetical protein
MNKKLLSSFLASWLLFSSLLFFPMQKASALTVMEIGGNLLTNIVTTIEQTIGTVEATISAVADDGLWTNDMIDRYLLPALKMAAIQMMHNIISNIVSGGNNGNAAFVTDWNDYLFKAPQKETRVYMNSFFNSVSAGRISGLNYEGVGQGYDKYLKTYSENALYGSSNQFKTYIQNYTSNPQTEMFSSGNFKAFSAFLDCPNNPYCMSMTAETVYQNELSRNTEVRNKLVNSSGYISKVINGKVVTPGSQFQSAMEGVDQLANGMIVNATKSEELVSGIISSLLRIATTSLVQGITK